MEKELEKYKREIAKSKTAKKLEEVRISLLGRKGKITQLFHQLGGKGAEERAKMGMLLNQVKKELEEEIKKREKSLREKKQEKKKEKDVYQPVKFGHLHPITITETLLNNVFSSLGFSVYEGPEIETDEFNFRRLNVPPNHPARGLQDSIYIKEPELLLTTQGSSVEARLLSQEKPPFRAAFPARVYRNEKVTKSNHFIFHHYQAVVVEKDISLKDLFGCVTLMFKTLYGPKTKTRYRCKYYPEVEPGVGVDMECFSCKGKGCPLCKGVGYIEMGGAGIIHPKVLQMAKINPGKWRGFAFGMGLDRWAMAKFGITDIRTLLGGNLAYQPNL